MGANAARRWAPTVLLPLLIVLAGLGSAPATGTTSPPFGPLRIDLDTDIDYVDPALAYYLPTWQIEQATCAKLLNQPDSASSSGGLEPEIAAAMPTVSADGRDLHFPDPQRLRLLPARDRRRHGSEHEVHVRTVTEPLDGLAGAVLLRRHRGRAKVHSRGGRVRLGHRRVRRHADVPARPPRSRLRGQGGDAVHLRGADLPPHQPGRRSRADTVGRSVLHLCVEHPQQHHCDSEPELHGASTAPLELDRLHDRVAPTDDPRARRGGHLGLWAGARGSAQRACDPLWPGQPSSANGPPAVVRDTEHGVSVPRDEHRAAPLRNGKHAQGRQLCDRSAGPDHSSRGTRRSCHRPVHPPADGRLPGRGDLPAQWAEHRRRTSAGGLESRGSDEARRDVHVQHGPLYPDRQPRPGQPASDRHRPPDLHLSARRAVHEDRDARRALRHHARGLA